MATSEAQCEVCGRSPASGFPRPGDCLRKWGGTSGHGDAECYRLGYTREHELAESLVIALTQSREYAEACRQRWAENKTRADGLQVELEESEAMAKSYLKAMECVSCKGSIMPPMQCGHCIENVKAVPRGMPARPATAALQERVEALEKQLANAQEHSNSQVRRAVNAERQLATKDVALQAKGDFIEWRKLLDAEKEKRTVVEAELARLRTLPDELREVVKLYRREHEDNAVCPSGDPTDFAYCDACRAAIRLDEADAPFPSAQQAAPRAAVCPQCGRAAPKSEPEGPQDLTVRLWALASAWDGRRMQHPAWTRCSNELRNAIEEAKRHRVQPAVSGADAEPLVDLRRAILDWREAAHCMGNRKLCLSCVDSLARAVAPASRSGSDALRRSLEAWCEANLAHYEWTNRNANPLSLPDPVRGMEVGDACEAARRNLLKAASPFVGQNPAALALPTDVEPSADAPLDALGLLGEARKYMAHTGGLHRDHDALCDRIDAALATAPRDHADTCGEAFNVEHLGALREALLALRAAVVDCCGLVQALDKTDAALNYLAKVTP